MYSYGRAMHTTLAAHPSKLVQKPTLRDVVEALKGEAAWPTPAADTVPDDVITLPDLCDVRGQPHGPTTAHM